MKQAQTKVKNGVGRPVLAAKDCKSEKIQAIFTPVEHARIIRKLNGQKPALFARDLILKAVS